jgi:Rieske Fe-S protein
MNGALVVPENRLAVVQASGSFHALDLTCTHLGCTVLATPKGFQCPCHGSRFDPEGRVLKGPAKDGLRPLRIEPSEEMLLVTLPERA